jgi:hypothetical protein
MTLDFPRTVDVDRRGNGGLCDACGASRQARAATALAFYRRHPRQRLVGPTTGRCRGPGLWRAPPSRSCCAAIRAGGPTLGGGLAGLWAQCSPRKTCRSRSRSPSRRPGPSRRPCTPAEPTLRRRACARRRVGGAHGARHGTALVPGVTDGWRAAVNLSVQSPSAARCRCRPGRWAWRVGARARRPVFVVESSLNLLPILENGSSPSDRCCAFR